MGGGIVTYSPENRMERYITGGARIGINGHLKDLKVGSNELLYLLDSSGCIIVINQEISDLFFEF